MKPKKNPYGATSAQLVFLMTANTGMRTKSEMNPRPSGKMKPGNAIENTNAVTNNIKTSEHTVLRLLLFKVFKP